MGREHRYHVSVEWTGNTGTGTTGYRDYGRNHQVTAEGKSAIAGSADAAFRGDKLRWNPEELLVAALSACHQLAYLHLCAVAGVVVLAYEDRAEGTMRETLDDAGEFVRVVLRPKVTIAQGSDAATAHALHSEAHAKCFIASSVNFPVEHEAQIVVGAGREANLHIAAQPSSRAVHGAP
jgi:organic hydroperoxide reductase OsmC/OhrA